MELSWTDSAMTDCVFQHTASLKMAACRHKLRKQMATLSTFPVQFDADALAIACPFGGRIDNSSMTARLCIYRNLMDKRREARSSTSKDRVYLPWLLQ
jgi:hypothetical protein